MFKVYSVTKQQTDYDGWSRGDSRVEATFADETKARQYMFEQTGQQTALDYGHASINAGYSNYQQWRINILEVQE